MSSTLSSLDRRKIRQERQRELILEAAERVFARRGLQSATMQEIADEAAYATGTLYRFFESREELCHTVLARRLGEFAAYLRERTLSADTPLERVEAFLEGFFEFFEANQPLMRFIVQAGYALGAEAQGAFQDQVVASQKDGIAQLEQLLTQAMQAGQIRMAPPRPLAVAMIGALRGLVEDWLASGEQRSLQRCAEEVGEVFERLLAPVEGRPLRVGARRNRA